MCTGSDRAAACYLCTSSVLCHLVEVAELRESERLSPSELSQSLFDFSLWIRLETVYPHTGLAEARRALSRDSGLAQRAERNNLAPLLLGSSQAGPSAFHVHVSATSACYCVQAGNGTVLRDGKVFEFSLRPEPNTGPCL